MSERIQELASEIVENYIIDRRLKAIRHVKHHYNDIECPCRDFVDAVIRNANEWEDFNSQGIKDIQWKKRVTKGGIRIGLGKRR